MQFIKCVNLLLFGICKPQIADDAMHMVHDNLVQNRNVVKLANLMLFSNYIIMLQVLHSTLRFLVCGGNISFIKMTI